MSCSQIKKITHQHYPKGIPFVYHNEVIVEDSLVPIDGLAKKLNEYWDDSIKVVTDRTLLIFNPIKSPIIYNPKYFKSSQKNMQDFLNIYGYFYSTISDSIHIKKYKKEERVYCYIKIKLGERLQIDSIFYNFNNPEIDSLLKKIYVKQQEQKNEFSSKTIADNINQIYQTLLNNGYFKIQRENIFALIDTFKPQVNSGKFINSTISYNFTPLTSPSQLQKYYFNNQYFYPGLSNLQLVDTILPYLKWNTIQKNGIFVRQNKINYRWNLFNTQTEFQKGDLFNSKTLENTLINLNVTNNWRQVKTYFDVFKDSINIHYYMVPFEKLSTIFDLEISNNTGTSIDPSTVNLLGLGANFTLKNRNFIKRGITTNLNFKIGSEININTSTTNFFQSQTFSTSIGYNWIIPHLLLPDRWIKNWTKIQARKTFTGINFSYINRFNYFTSQILTYNWGYEWRKNFKNLSVYFVFRPINIEIYQINKENYFDSLLSLNPFLRASFNEGNVIGISVTSIIDFKPKIKNLSQTLRINIEESGLYFSPFPNINSIFKYIKFDFDYRLRKSFSKSELAYKIFTGIGLNYNPQFNTLPFFKQYTAGGPNSMRGWVVRQLGLGSSIAQDTIGLNNYRDRFGDFQFETNLEYRFSLFKLGSIHFNSAAFIDIGNIWNIKNNVNDEKSIINFSRIIQDMAIAIGSGIRVDFASYFVLRFDVGLKLKDPTRNYNQGWIDFNNFRFSETKQNSAGNFTIDNLAFQLGIGLPF